MDIYHVTPNNDLKRHSMSENIPCACQPRTEQAPEGHRLIIHNAYDGREFYEEWFTKEGSGLTLTGN
jgi:hypothetical protein